ncbi:MAG: ketosteroid isomerase-like protein [Rhodothermales bacterium]|jgi:ketosteroid isomerase-like protein
MYSLLPLIVLLFAAVCGPLEPTQTEDANTPATDQLDAYWAEVSRTVAEGDFEGYSITYHPDAVLVNQSGGVSYPIAQALDGWKQGFDDTAAGKMAAQVEFRFTQRLNDETTAHETGMFHYTAATDGGEPEGSPLHFQALLVKQDGHWLMVMEYQMTPATMEEWDAAG